MTSSNKPKILFIAPSLRRAGAQTQLVDLIVGMNGEHFNEFVFTFQSYNDQLDRLDLSKVKFFTKERNYKYDVLGVAKYIADLIVEHEIDIVHCTLQFSLLLGWLGIKKSSKRIPPKLVAAIHTTQNRSFKEEMQDRLLYRWLLMVSDKVIFVCEKQMNVWLDKFPALKKNSLFVYNGVDPDYFNPDNYQEQGKQLRTDLNIENNAPVLCCIARFRPEKGHHHLVASFSKLPSECHLLLAGDGEMQENIEEKCKQLGITNRVHFLGSISDVRPVVAASDISVLASTAVETFSITMLESLSMCVPVVATDIGGMSEAVISEETGELVSPGNEAELTAALLKIIESEDNRHQMGINGRKSVIEKFSRDLMVKNTEIVFNELVK